MHGILGTPTGKGEAEELRLAVDEETDERSFGAVAASRAAG